MFIKNHLQVWQDKWRHLTKPDKEITGDEARQQARLLASLSLALLVVGSIALVIWVVVSPNFSAAPFISAGVLFALAIVYGLSRKSSYQWGAYLFVVALLLMVVIMLITAPGSMPERMLPLNFLAAVILLAGILLSGRSALGIVAVCLGVTAVFFFLPGIPFTFTYAYFVFILIMSALLLVTFKIRSGYLRRLQASEERFRRLTLQSPDTIYIYNLKTHQAQFINREEFLGYSLQELEQTDSMFSQIHPEDFPAVQTYWQRLSAGETSGLQVVDFRVRHKEGQWEWVHNRVTILTYTVEGEPEQILVTLTVLTDLKRVESALRESEARLRLVMNQIPALLWTTDSELRITSSLGLGLKGLGLLPNEAVGRTLYEHFDTTDTNFPSITAHLQALRGESQHYELNWLDHVYQSYLEPLRDGNGRIIGVIGVSLDVTEQVKVEKALQQAQKLESLGILAGGVAHDFNNLLVAMLGQASLALGKLPPENSAYPHIEKVTQAATRAADLTRQLLAYSGRGKFEIHFLQLNKLIKENIHLFRVAMPKNVELRTNLAEKLPLIEADVGQMQQVVMNLIINGAEAVGENTGTVTVMTFAQTLAEADEELGWFSSQPLSPGEYVVLAVQDNGSGMDKATLAKIFDPFFTTKFLGRGLGLASVLGIVRGHGGGLQVDSAVGEGTTFRLFLPAIEGRVAVAETAVIHGQAEALSKMGCVLVIDDEATVREAVTDILEMAHIEVLTAVDGASGIALYKEKQAEIRLVLLDLSMPGLSGEETLTHLQEIDPYIPVCLSSGYSEGDWTERFAGAKTVHFLQKPYDVGQLLATVRPFFSEK